MTSVNAPITVYFDNSCPVCREEIAALKAMDADNALTLVDCSLADFNDDDATRAGLSQNTLKQTLHIRDGKGEWYSAVDAFVVMYEAVGFDAAANLLKSRYLRRVFDWMYPVFVNHRHKLRWLGAHKLMPWIIRRAASRQAAKAATCANRVK